MITAASVPVDPPGSTEGATCFGGWHMNAKEKMLIVWLLLVVALGFFLSHFWSFTVLALQKAVATATVPLLVSKFLAGISATHSLR